METSKENLESITVLAIGDPHFKVSNVKETDAMVEAIIKTAIDKKPDIIIVLGDILDRHETIHVSPLTRATNFLEKLIKISPVFILIGNHDLKNNRQFLSDEHPFTALKNWGTNMTVVDTTTLINIKGHKFVFVPYVPPGRFEEALNKCEEWKSATCIFAHQEFKGVKMGAIISIEGDDWPLTYPYVVSGHIHDYQEPQVNILYTGTPIQHAFGDRHDKTVSYLTYYSHIKRDHERIDLGLPRKHIIYLTCAEVSNYVPQHNCELKIIIQGTSSEIKAIMKHPNIDIWKRAGYRVVYKDIPLKKIQHTEQISYIKPSFSTVLYQTICDDIQLESLYTKIFGKLDVSQNSPKIIPTERNIAPNSRLVLKIEPSISYT